MEQVALDGPVASGKTSVAQLLARKLGYLYLDTGAMYRAVALLALENGVGAALSRTSPRYHGRSLGADRLPRHDRRPGPNRTPLQAGRHRDGFDRGRAPRRAQGTGRAPTGTRP